MLIIFGHYSVENKIGVVADHCAVCGGTHVLRVVRHFRKAHLYFLPLGSGELVGTTKTCTSCDNATDCPPNVYTDIIPEDAALKLSLGQILWRTNPILAESIANRIQLELDAAQWDGRRGAGPDPRVNLAFAKLADFHIEDPRAARFRSLLDRWETLDATMQDRLLRDVDGLDIERHQHQDRVHFLNTVASLLKTGVEGPLKVVIFGVCLGLGSAFVVGFLNGTGMELVGFGSVLGVAALVTGLFHWQYKPWVYRRFFRKVFLPQADKRAIPVAALMEMLGRIDPADKSIDERLRGLARAIPILKEVLAEQNRYMELPVEGFETAASSRF